MEWGSEESTFCPGVQSSRYARDDKKKVLLGDLCVSAVKEFPDKLQKAQIDRAE